MKTYRTRQQLQNKVADLGQAGKLKRPTCEVVAMPNWMLIEIIKLNK